MRKWRKPVVVLLLVPRSAAAAAAAAGPVSDAAAAVGASSRLLEGQTARALNLTSGGEQAAASEHFPFL